MTIKNILTFFFNQKKNNIYSIYYKDLILSFLIFPLQIPAAIKQHYINPPSLLPKAASGTCSTALESSTPREHGEITLEEQEEVKYLLKSCIGNVKLVSQNSDKHVLISHVVIGLEKFCARFL